jgi:hypothetical protein
MGASGEDQEGSGKTASEADRMSKPEEKRHGHNVQYPPVSRKPLELVHG